MSEAHHIYTKSPQQVEADKAAQTSMILGIIGLFALGIILGPLAIMQAKKAERLGAAATVGKVTGWISTIFGVIGLLVFILWIIAFIAAGTAASTY